LQMSTTGQESIVYCLSWAPAPLGLLAAATASNGVLFVDATTGRISHRFLGHGASVSVYCTAWCQADTRRVASGGADGTCLVTHNRGQIEVQRCIHPGPVFGCDWQGSDMLATGCEDGDVRVFKITCNNKETPIRLSGDHSVHILILCKL
jgi:WD40 repeat protein